MVSTRGCRPWVETHSTLATSHKFTWFCHYSQALSGEARILFRRTKPADYQANSREILVGTSPLSKDSVKKRSRAALPRFP